MSSHQRAELLISQQRYDMARQELGRILAEDPQDANAHLMMAVCLQQMNLLQEATEEAQQAIHLSPTDARAHATLGSIFLKRSRCDDAEEALQEALRLDAYDDLAFRLMAAVKFEQKQWKSAIEFAEQALSIDADDTTSQNLRALSLEKLGNTKVAVEATRETIAKNPDDAFTHATHGWALLHDGNHREAQEAFREALRLEPNNEFAQQGMIQALNANYFLFRCVFQWYSMMARLSDKAQWGVIIGLLLAQRLMRVVAREFPALRPVIVPLLVIYFLFVISTWIANPLFNTFLRFHQFGKYLLTKRQMMASNFMVGVFCLGIVLGIALAFVTQAAEGLAFGFGFGILMLLPVSATFNCEPGYPQNVMAAVSIALGVIGLLGFGYLFVGMTPSPTHIAVFLLGNIAAQFLGLKLMTVEVRK